MLASIQFAKPFGVSLRVCVCECVCPSCCSIIVHPSPCLLASDDQHPSISPPLYLSLFASPSSALSIESMQWKAWCCFAKFGPLSGRPEHQPPYILDDTQAPSPSPLICRILPLPGRPEHRRAERLRARGRSLRVTRAAGGLGKLCHPVRQLRSGRTKPPQRQRQRHNRQGVARAQRCTGQHASSPV
jgi:hypothetical protein